MKHTIGTAAKATGKSKATIHRAVKSGVLSASRREDGTYEIDAAELHRVFPIVSSSRSDEREMMRCGTAQNDTETPLLRQENDFLRQQLEREREFSRELSRRLDQSEAERRETQSKLTALLTHQPETASPPPPTEEHSKGRLFDKLFGRTKKSF